VALRRADGARAGRAVPGVVIFGALLVIASALCSSESSNVTAFIRASRDHLTVGAPNREAARYDPPSATFTYFSK
jgi:hypothetical protein